MASTLQQLENQGASSTTLENQLTDNLSNAIEGSNSASAILAAGNSDAVNLDSQIATKLNSTDNKERYAAASVLARNPDYNDEVIQHLVNESSDLVSYAILTNLDSKSLSSQQKDELQSIADSSSSDIRTVIDQLLQ